MNKAKRILIFIVLLGLTAGCSNSQPAESTQAYRARQDELGSEQILDWLKAGNRRFAAGLATHGGFPQDARERATVASTGQRPLAVILSCIDSRTTPELVFDTSVGDLFTIRVGANVVNDDIVGSMEIAAASGAKVLVVLGHTDCGGIKGACGGLELGHMTQLLERIKPVIAKVHAHLDSDFAFSREVGERAVTNRRYIAEVSHANARNSVELILQKSELLRDQVKKGEVTLVSALYNVDTGAVTFDPVIQIE